MGVRGLLTGLPSGVRMRAGLDTGLKKKGTTTTTVTLTRNALNKTPPGSAWGCLVLLVRPCMRGPVGPAERVDEAY